MPYDCRRFLRWITEEFEPSVRLPGPAGSYAREVGARETELYGISDMACILYTLGRLRPTEKERAEWNQNFQSLQDPVTGCYLERQRTHIPLHNTAFALGAMELLELGPARPLVFAREYAAPEKLRAFLEGLAWRKTVYKDSHAGAGLASVMVLAPGLVGPDWFASYFAWLDARFDPRNGMLGQDKPDGGDFDQIGGTFHYHFLYEFFRRRMPFPERRIDAIIGLQQPDGYWHPQNHLWLTLDAVYMLTRTVRHCHHRPRDVEGVVRRVLEVFMSEVISPDGRARHFGGRLGVHCLTAVVSLLAEAQQFLGAEEVLTEMPLRLVLDRRPFI